MYAKVIKWLSWVLLIAGVVVSVYGFVVGFDTNNASAVDLILYWAYAMAALAIAGVVLVGLYVTATTNPKGLVKLLIGLVAAVAVIAGAYVLAPGTPAVGYLGDPVTPMTLKLTDTILNLTYLCCAGAVLAILGGAVVSAIRI